MGCKTSGRHLSHFEYKCYINIRPVTSRYIATYILMFQDFARYRSSWTTSLVSHNRFGPQVIRSLAPWPPTVAAHYRHSLSAEVTGNRNLAANRGVQWTQTGKQRYHKVSKLSLRRPKLFIQNGEDNLGQLISVTIRNRRSLKLSNQNLSYSSASYRNYVNEHN